ncbi:MAG: glycosyltransferase family 4 protein [Cyanobacteria bacterium J06600_6]
MLDKNANVYGRVSNSIFTQYQSENDSKTQRLSIITQFYPPDYAATGQLIQELARQLGSHNIKTSVFTGQPGYAFSQENAPNKEISRQVKIKRTRTTRFWSKRVRGKTLNGILFCLRASLHILKHRRKIDTLLLTTAPPFLSAIGYFSNLLLGIPYICLVYDLYPDVVTELKVSSNDSVIVKIWRGVNKRVWGKAEHIIVLSSTMRDRLIGGYPNLERKVSIIENWADPNQIKPLDKMQNWFAQEHKIDNKFTILYSGNLGRCHDAQTILATMKLLQNDPVQFVFIGSGAKYENCRQQTIDWGIHNCLFLPFQPKEVLPFSLTACDLALVSIASGLEGVVVPSKLYGVMAAGVAVAAICEPHSYLRPLLDGLGCGACFDNNDAEKLAEFIRNLATCPERAKEMGSNGRKYLLDNCTPQIIARQYARVIKDDQMESISSKTSKSSEILNT